MKPILEIKNISKQFRIRHEQHAYLNIRDSIASVFKKSTSTTENFFALNDISFDVYPGDSVGIIGKNGAGKSTLLKILSKITPPSSGKIISRGRIASLLEVGTGFHPELSGRENIFLNGSILGMRRKEIEKRFDEIVDFSGVENFLDTPLKHFSSGMQLRLAFAVAAFLEPEVLVIDEVLAVGDMEFQKKCMGKMEEVSTSGRTILFVSHNMGAVKNLCKKGVLLEKGKIKTIGDATSVLETYVKDFNILSDKKRKIIKSKCGRLSLKLPYWIDDKGNEVLSYTFGENYTLRFEYVFHEKMKGINPGMAIVSKDGFRVFTSHLNDDFNFKMPEVLEGNVIIDTHINLPSLSPDTYQVLFGTNDDLNHTIIDANNEMEVQLQIIEGNKEKEATHGILWHTGSWKIS